MTIRTKIIAAVISAAVLDVAFSAFAETPSDDHARRQAALSWAASQQQIALRAVLGPATRADVVLPICRVVTIRPSSVSDDRREFRILIKETCSRTIESATVMVMDTPLTVQLAKMKFEDNNLSVESAIPRLRFERSQLTPRHARRILELLDHARLSLIPLQAFVLDKPGIEVSVASWGEVRAVTYLGDTRPGWKQLNAAITEALRLSRVDLSRLSFDPSVIEQ